jgi:cytochrome c biogenesis protein CcdA
VISWILSPQEEEEQWFERISSFLLFFSFFSVVSSVVVCFSFICPFLPKNHGTLYQIVIILITIIFEGIYNVLSSFLKHLFFFVGLLVYQNKRK